MLRFLPAPLRGLIAALILAINTIFWCIPLFALAILKFIIPISSVRRLILAVMHFIAEGWISVNTFWLSLVQKTTWDVQGDLNVDKNHIYLVSSNHQSWADIFAVQTVFNRKMPMLKFFLKQELIWVPVMGLAWWALEFPFMKRYTKAYLAKYPHKQGQDLATTRKACERYKITPVSVFNFLEGTRFTPVKHQQQQSPFNYLLKPKAGGIAFVLDAMGEQLESLVNVTIYYPNGAPDFWGLLCGKMDHVVIRVEQMPIPKDFIGKSYDTDPQYREEFQVWVNNLWLRKDALLAELHRSIPAKKQ